MFSNNLSELKFAQKYPFSNLAKRIVKNSGFSLESVSDEVVSRARFMVLSAISGKKYFVPIESYSDLILNEVLAFPVAKVLVALVNKPEVIRRFGVMFSEHVFDNLSKESLDSVLFDLASELGLSVELSDRELDSVFVEVGLLDYLKAHFFDVSMKLVNKRVVSGKVLLSKQEFCRLLSLVVYAQLIDSLPIGLKNVPQKIVLVAKQLDQEFSNSLKLESVSAGFSSGFGSVSPELFPPCMLKLYEDLLSGVNVSHSGRFAIATFLNSIGMPPDSIVNVFSKTPNFDERLTRYHVFRLVGKGGLSYSSPGCDKMRSYGLCVADCPVQHPLQFYSNAKKSQLKENSRSSGCGEN